MKKKIQLPAETYISTKKKEALSTGAWLINLSISVFVVISKTYWKFNDSKILVVWKAFLEGKKVNFNTQKNWFSGITTGKQDN